MTDHEDFQAMDTQALLAMLPELRDESASLRRAFFEEGAEWGDRALEADDELTFLEDELRRRKALSF